MQIEEGKYYKTKDGRRIGPAKHAYGTDWEFPGEWDSVHSSSGHYYGHDEGLEIVSEWDSRIKLEEGKYYRTRDGQKFGPARAENRKVAGQDAFEFQGSHASVHLADGTYAGKNKPELDIVAEWTERTPQVIVAEIDALMAELKEHYR